MATTRTRTARRAGIVSVVALGAGAVVACGGGENAGTQAEIDFVEEDKFVCAMSGEYRPFNFLNDDNELVGIDVEVCEAIAEDLGVEAEPATGAFNTLVQGLQSQRYDAIIGSMAITEERQEVVDFSDPYYETGAQLFVPPNSEVESVEDLDSAVIGVALGTTFEEHASELEGVAEVTTYQADIDALQDLNNGRLDGVITQELIGRYQISQADLDVEPVGELLYDDIAAIPVNPGNDALLREINESLEAMQEDGRFDEIMDRWFNIES